MQQTLVIILPFYLLVVTFGSDEMSLHVNAGSLRALAHLATCWPVWCSPCCDVSCVRL